MQPSANLLPTLPTASSPLLAGLSSWYRSSPKPNLSSMLGTPLVGACLRKRPGVSSAKQPYALTYSRMVKSCTKARAIDMLA